MQRYSGSGMGNGHIDIVKIYNEETGITHEILPIAKLEEATRKAIKMTKYHHKKYSIKIENVLKTLYPQFCHDYVPALKCDICGMEGKPRYQNDGGTIKCCDCAALG